MIFKYNIVQPKKITKHINHESTAFFEASFREAGEYADERENNLQVNYILLAHWYHIEE